MVPPLFLWIFVKKDNPDCGNRHWSQKGLEL